MYVARCMFENARVLKTYDYKINQKQRLTLKRGDNVIVTRKRAGTQSPCRECGCHESRHGGHNHRTRLLQDHG